ncbi:dihydroorotate dehydrogenase [Jackrogersella minutella]|nr:dihydroorotate dehydrogenase [Jackrogersella minutella]
MALLPPPSLHINPPLLNSANPWATTFEDLKALYECPSTGAVTTRTALLRGFAHDPDRHQYSFFNPATNAPRGRVSSCAGADADAAASLNNMGYSPVPLDEYLRFIEAIAAESGSEKGFIVSVTGTPEDVAACYDRVARARARVRVPLAVEVNLSCPNIPGAPPPAYEPQALARYLGRVAARGGGAVPWGVKTPPYTHAAQFDMLARALRDAGDGRACPVSFVTATNTLGSCLLLNAATSDPNRRPTLAGSGIGGMAGAPLHPLALGNVATLREMLDGHPSTRHISVIGVGGVEDADGYRRMRDVGAAVVGVGTALGRRGVGVFGEIEGGLGGKW